MLPGFMDVRNFDACVVDVAAAARCRCQGPSQQHPMHQQHQATLWDGGGLRLGLPTLLSTTQHA